MVIQNMNVSGAILTNTRPARANQTYTDVYFVTEHQPSNCNQYPANGQVLFTDIEIAWNGVTTTPTWSAQQFQPACNCQAKVVSPSSILFTWTT